jgi:hypothetical protein
MVIQANISTKMKLRKKKKKEEEGFGQTLTYLWAIKVPLS